MSKNSLLIGDLVNEAWLILSHYNMDDRQDGAIQVTTQAIEKKTSGYPSIFINIIYAALHPGMKPILISVAGTSQEEAIMKFEGAVINAKHAKAS